jgi:hypothetical protein
MPAGLESIEVARLNKEEPKKFAGKLVEAIKNEAAKVGRSA